MLLAELPVFNNGDIWGKHVFLRRVIRVQENKPHTANISWNCELLFYLAKLTSSWRLIFPNTHERRSANACLSSRNSDSCVSKGGQDSWLCLCHLWSLLEQVSDFKWLWDSSSWMRGLIHKWQVQNQHSSLKESNFEVIHCSGFSLFSNILIKLGNGSAVWLGRQRGVSSSWH